jgi:hypothetical protein
MKKTFGYLAVGFIFCGFVVLPISLFGLSACWYGLRYQTDPKSVQVQERPENCDFSWSPIGEKGCHYDKVVTINQTGRTSYGAQVTSQNDGGLFTLRTWYFVDGSRQTHTAVLGIDTVAVDVSWVRVQE